MLNVIEKSECNRNKWNTIFNYASVLLYKKIGYVLNLPSCTIKNLQNRTTQLKVTNVAKQIIKIEYIVELYRVNTYLELISRVKLGEYPK